MADYKTGENALLLLIQGIQGFDGKNTAIGKWGLLNSGHSDHYAIIKQGETNREWVTFRTLAVRARSIVEVWQRVKDDGTTYDELLTHVDNITARIDQYRLFGDDSGTVLDANVTGSSAVTEQWRNNSDGPSWLKKELYVDWSEHDEITFAE